MKNKICISGLFGIMLLVILGFSGGKEDDAPFKENKNLLINNSGSNLNGPWGLVSYFDTIVTNKQIAKYRLQVPAWFAILIEIRADSLECFGSIERAAYPLKRANDTLAVLSSNAAGSHWYLIKKEFELHLVQAPNEKDPDSTIYVFRKRDDLKYFFKKGAFEENVAHYFNNLLFQGKYINTDTKQKIVFGGNEKLTGIEGFTAYRVRNYFGTLHMYNNRDVIYFLDANGQFKPYNWVFAGEELLLTEFIPEKATDENGNVYNGDFFILGDRKIRLKKVKCP